VSKLTVFCDHDLVACAHVSAGLCDMRQAGMASLAFLLAAGVRRHLSAPVVVRMLFQGQRIAFDFHDDHACWDEDALAWSNIYWKSNYHSQFLPLAHHSKIRPYGLYFPARSAADVAMGSRLLGSALVAMNYRFHKYGHLSAGDLVSAFQRVRRYKSRLTVKAYEAATPSSTRPLDIYFNPGCWPMNVTKNQEANLTRSRLIKLLRDTFPARFLGGFVSNGVSQEFFPDQICSEVTSHLQYVQTLQRARIVISTNGLAGCHSWRTAEALAAGAVLVTERPVNKVDERFVDGENVFFFDTPEDCQKICADILRLDVAALDHLQEASRRYYAENVAPQRSLLNKLKSIGCSVV
jgi:hypothetical protein